MRSSVHTISEELPLHEVAATLIRHGLKGMPVIRDGRLIGIVSQA
jgi:CBS domain-containing protein